MTSGVCASLSASSVRRWLAADALKPWQHRSWISIRDPDFEAKAARVLDLYAGRWKGRRLGPNDFVICADEKTSIQARCRCHPTLPPGRARTMRVEHEYERGGALAYLAAWDVHRGQVIGRCEDTTGIEPGANRSSHADTVPWISCAVNQRHHNRLQIAGSTALTVLAAKSAEARRPPGADTGRHFETGD